MNDIDIIEKKKVLNVTKQWQFQSIYVSLICPQIKKIKCILKNIGQSTKFTIKN